MDELNDTNDRYYTLKRVAAGIAIILSIAIGVYLGFKNASKGKRIETIVKYTTEAGEVFVEKHTLRSR